MAENQYKKITRTLVVIVAVLGLLLSSAVLAEGIRSSSRANLEQPSAYLESSEDSIPTPQPTSTFNDIEVPIQ